MFSQLAHLLAPRRRKIGRQLLAALQCIRAWMGLGMTTPSEMAEPRLTDAEMDVIYDICHWEEVTD
jgi:hypothetical protein